MLDKFEPSTADQRWPPTCSAMQPSSLAIAVATVTSDEGGCVYPSGPTVKTHVSSIPTKLDPTTASRSPCSSTTPGSSAGQD